MSRLLGRRVACTLSVRAASAPVPIIHTPHWSHKLKHLAVFWWEHMQRDPSDTEDMVRSSLRLRTLPFQETMVAYVDKDQCIHFTEAAAQTLEKPKQQLLKRLVEAMQ